MSSPRERKAAHGSGSPGPAVTEGGGCALFWIFLGGCVLALGSSPFLQSSGLVVAGFGLGALVLDRVWARRFLTDRGGDGVHGRATSPAELASRDRDRRASTSYWNDVLAMPRSRLETREFVRQILQSQEPFPDLPQILEAFELPEAGRDEPAYLERTYRIAAQWTRAEEGHRVHLATLLRAHAHACVGHGETAMQLALSAMDSLQTQERPPWELALGHAVLTRAAQLVGNEEFFEEELSYLEDAVPRLGRGLGPQLVRRLFRELTGRE